MQQSREAQRSTHGTSSKWKIPAVHKRKTLWIKLKPCLDSLPASRLLKTVLHLKFKIVTLMRIDEKVKKLYCSAVYLICKVIIFIDNKEK